MDKAIKTYEIISVNHVKRNVKLGDDIYNQYDLKVKNITDGFIEAKMKLINVNSDKGQIVKGHIYTSDMYLD